MDFAAAVNEEVRDLFAAGADIVQIDEPWLQSRADKASEFALPAIDRALAGVGGTTALHTCFGYAHVVHDRPPGYPFLAELAGCAADVLAIEAAQPRLDPAVLEPLAGKTVDRRRARPGGRAAVRRPSEVAERIEAALRVIPPERLQVGPDCGMKYLPRDLAFAKLRALVEGARLRPRAARSSRANCGWVGRRGSISSQSPRRARSVLRNSPIASTSSHGRTVGGRLLRNAPWPPYPAAVTNSRSGRAYAPLEHLAEDGEALVGLGEERVEEQRREVALRGRSTSPRVARQPTAARRSRRGSGRRPRAPSGTADVMPSRSAGRRTGGRAVGEAEVAQREGSSWR